MSTLKPLVLHDEAIKTEADWATFQRDRWLVSAGPFVARRRKGKHKQARRYAVFTQAGINLYTLQLGGNGRTKKEAEMRAAKLNEELATALMLGKHEHPGLRWVGWDDVNWSPRRFYRGGFEKPKG